MSRFRILLLSFIVVILPTVSSFADSSEVGLRLDLVRIPSWPPADRAPVGEVIEYGVRWWVDRPVAPNELLVELDLPGALSDLRGDGLTCVAGQPVRCTSNERGARGGLLRFSVRVTKPGVQSMVARISSTFTSPDPFPDNNTITHTFEGLAVPSLVTIARTEFGNIEPAEDGVIRVDVENRAATPAKEVVLTMALPLGGKIRSGVAQGVDAACSVANNILTCNAPSLAGNGVLSISVGITAPERLVGGDVMADVEVRSAEEDFDRTDNRALLRIPLAQQFIVSNVNDEGAGSLRQAMLDVNANCSGVRPCTIFFRIPPPVPAEGWFTIRPFTPLPEVVASIEIDGDAQTVLTGNTNPAGPEIELDGVMLAEGSGLRIRPTCQVNVHGLAINHFPGYGVESRRERTQDGPCVWAGIQTSVINNYLGVDPTGTVAKPNQRGVGVFTGRAQIERNLISGNRRSGVFLEDGFHTLIQENRIGVAADGSPLGNGCGIYVDTDDFSFVDILNNVIANNEMSIGRTRRGLVLVQRNSIYDNVMQGIDVDLDGPTPNQEETPNEGEVRMPNRPVLYSATYDAARGATIVRGRIDGNLGFWQELEIFSSDRLSVWAQPQAQESLVLAQISGDQDFELAIPRDLRGKWITSAFSALYAISVVAVPGTPATETTKNDAPGNTSELSDAIFVH